MRFWPPVQMILVVALLGGALYGLLAIDPTARGIGQSPETESSRKDRPLAVYAEIEATAPLERLVLSQGETILFERHGTFEQITAEFELRTHKGSRPDLEVSGRFHGSPSHSALRVMIEPEGRPDVERILWSRGSERLREVIPLSRDD